LLAYQLKWLPQSEATSETLAQALFLEDDNLEQQKIAICNGIALALGGE